MVPSPLLMASMPKIISFGKFCTTNTSKHPAVSIFLGVFPNTVSRWAVTDCSPRFEGERSEVLCCSLTSLKKISVARSILLLLVSSRPSMGMSSTVKVK